MDLLRVISHHKARLATPIRTVQKMYNDTDLDSMPFVDSMYTRGGVSPRRPLLLIEPSYKINGEDKKRSRSGQTGGERDGKATPRPSTESKTSETLASDTKGDARAPNPIAKSGSNSKTRSKDAEKSDSDSDSKAVNLTSDPSTENISSRKQVNPSFSSSPVKQEGEKTPAAELPTARPAREENIVLGVALEGSKRTLPIDEEMTSPSQTDNDLAYVRKGNASSNSDKGKKNDQVPAAPGTTSDNE